MTHPIFQGIQSGHGLSAKALQLMRMLDRLRNPLDALGFRPELANLTAEDLAAIEAHLEACAKRLSGAQARYLNGEEAWASLAFAVVSAARAKVALRLSASDLKETVLAYCHPQDHTSWLNRTEGAPAGLLRHEGEVRKRIEPQGVLFWDHWQDEQWRIVDSRWLQAHADMFRWVVGAWPGGRRCRFCGMQESSTFEVLLPVELERRNGRTMIGDLVVLDSGSSALTHEPCRPHWLQLLATIAPYRCLAEAEAADAAAGRRSRPESVQTSARPAQPVGTLKHG